jgi:hypothetical protein
MFGFQLYIGSAMVALTVVIYTFEIWFWAIRKLFEAAEIEKAEKR